MASLAERLPSQDWWVAKTKPSRAIQFSKQLDVENYLPLKRTRKSVRPLVPYVFIRAVGKVNAWMCPGFVGWLLTNGVKATVPDSELSRFRSQIDMDQKQSKTRVLLKVNANTEIRGEV